MGCMVWKPENRCFMAAPPQKGHFLAKNGQKKCQFWAKKRFFLGLGAQFKAPLPYFLGA